MGNDDTRAAREGRYEAILAAAPLLIFTLDRNGVFTLSEGRALERLGREPNEVRGRHIRDVYPDYPEILAAVERAFQGQSTAIEVTVGPRSFEAHYTPTFAPDGSIDGVTGVAFDITERFQAQRDNDLLIARLQESEAHYRQAATHDPLTGLANSRLFFDELERAIAHGRRHQQQLGVAYVDLDGLKSLNDRLGHLAGDRAIRGFGEHLAGWVRAGDLVARLGGDEFAVLLSPGPDELLPAKVAERLSRPVALGGVLPGETVTVRASVGVAIFPADGQDAQGLLRAADDAMYEAKRNRVTGELTSESTMAQGAGGEAGDGVPALPLSA